MPVCFTCRVPKKTLDFARNQNRESGRHSSCRECKSKYNVKWYAKNKAKHMAMVHRNNKRYYEDRLRFMREMKNGPCRDCKHTFHPCVMDFDHLGKDKKISNISNMARSGLSRVKILAEIAKCELVCANCHRMRTFKRREAARK